MILLGDHFSRDDRSRHSEWLRRRQWFIKAKQEHQQKEEITNKLDDEILSFAVEAIVVTEIQIKNFRTKLDDYDQATVTALMENQELQAEIKRRLIDVQTRIQDMLDRAYVMEDGRRVFLTEDQTQAFDEHGKEVTQDELDFNLVPENNPSWETIVRARAEKDNLLADFKKAKIEQTQILEFQEKVDHAREKIDGSEITKEELDDLDSELADAMPQSVRANVPGFDTASNVPELKSEFASPTGWKSVTEEAALTKVSQSHSRDPSF